MSSTQKKIPLQLQPLSFCGIPNWTEDDHCEAMASFKLSCQRMKNRPYTTKALGVSAEQLAQLASTIDQDKILDRGYARGFFEENFVPYQFKESGYSGILTGYYEPVHRASKIRTKKFQYPLYRRPPDLIDLDDANRPNFIDSSFAFARQEKDQISYFFDRSQIQAGALAKKELELFWLEDPVDVFFIHIQGSARLLLPDGSTARVSYAAKSGHPYHPIGKTLIEWGELSLDAMSMNSIREWIKINPHRREELLATNPSYIFFQQTQQTNPTLGPVAAAGVTLTPGRSLAIDRHIHTFGTPIWVESKIPLPSQDTPLARLLIAQDTGSAIIGAERGDLFVGCGEEAGKIAGKINHAIAMTVLVPKGAKNARSGWHQL